MDAGDRQTFRLVAENWWGGGVGLSRCVSWGGQTQPVEEVKFCDAESEMYLSIIASHSERHARRSNSNTPSAMGASRVNAQ